MNTIMMIDDDESAHVYHKLMLENAHIPTGIKVLNFTSSVEALGHLKRIVKDKEGLPSLILVDINMPELNGWELVQEMEEMELISKTKVYVVSHSKSSKDMEKAKAFKIDFKQKFLTTEFFICVLNGKNENV